MAKCPYCNKELVKFPGRKTKCPHCGNFIYVRTKPGNKQRILIKENQIEQIEQEWREYLFNSSSVSDFRNRLKSQYEKNFDNKYSDIKNELTKRFKTEPSEADILWGLSNYLLSEFMKKDDLGEMKMVYFHQARFLYEDGKDYLWVLQQVHKCDLMAYVKSGVVKKVEIVTCKENSCPSCHKLDGKIYTIEQALKEMPIPEKNCSNDPNPKSKKGWCRCYYGSVIE